MAKPTNPETSQIPAPHQDGVINRLTWGVSLFALKLLGVGAGAWGGTHLLLRVDNGVLAPEAAASMWQAAMVGVGASLLLKPQGFWRRAAVGGTVAALAYAGMAGGRLAENQVPTPARGQVNVAALLAQPANGPAQ